MRFPGRRRRLADAEGPRAVGEKAAAGKQVDDQGLAGSDRLVVVADRVGHAGGGAGRDDVALGLVEVEAGELHGDGAAQPADRERRAFQLEPRTADPARRQHRGDAPESGADSLRRVARRRLLLRPLALPIKQRQLPAVDELPASGRKLAAGSDHDAGRGVPGERQPPRLEAAGRERPRQQLGPERRLRRMLLAERLDPQLVGRQQPAAGRGRLVALHRGDVAECRISVARRDDEGRAEMDRSDERSQVRVPARVGDDQEGAATLRRQPLGQGKAQGSTGRLRGSAATGLRRSPRRRRRRAGR